MYCSINKLSLMYCSINKLKSHMLFTCKNFMFSNFTWKKKFCSRKWWGIPDPSFLYGPVTCNKLDLMMKLDSIKYLKHPVNLQDTVQKLPPEVFYKKDAVTNFAKFTGKHLCQSLFLNKVADLRLWHSVFLSILLNLGTPFFTEHLQVATFVCIKYVFRDPSLDFRS